MCGDSPGCFAYTESLAWSWKKDEVEVEGVKVEPIGGPAELSSEGAGRKPHALNCFSQAVQQ